MNIKKKLLKILTNRIKKGYNFNGINNKVLIIENGTERELKQGRIKGLYININGNNNVIKLEQPINFGHSSINIEGCSNCLVEIGSTKYCIGSLNIHFGNSNNQKIRIGRDIMIVNAFLASNEEHGKIIIGNDCMFAASIAIVASDGHAIFDEETKKIINRQKSPLLIGDHVWIGEGAKLMKNSRIPNNSIVGAYSVVTKPFYQNNIILAGNPARIIRENINWSREQISQLNENI